MNCPIYIVDAFTDKAFKGNPAAVCLLNEDVDSNWMQSVAAEMNLSETAFLRKSSKGFELRWFTPEVEVDLCGHATLASAHILWESSLLENSEVAIFNSKSGVLTAEKKNKEIELNFPSMSIKEIGGTKELQEALGIDFVYSGKAKGYYIFEVESEDIVINTKPDFSALKKITDCGVIVTSKSFSKEFDFVSRFFAPAYGINEDPVTGSAHCVLGPYWMKKLNKNNMRAFQASKRGGVLSIRVEDERVYIAGEAVTVLKGELLV
ncbi:MAG: PhzF family phenazine biosynthesis protein [Ignavibacteria bacterium]|nr:PhzF family phenazine biosynthesis protein [Ignavibacteria bacterium]